MSVFTRVEPADLEAFLRDYAVGESVDLRGIAAGIENTNYFVTTADGEYVLTLFEQHDAAELPWYLGLMDHLAAAGVPAPQPVRRTDAGFLGELNGRPAALISRLPGTEPVEPSVNQCAATGRGLGELHVAGADYPEGRENPRGPRWWRESERRLADRLDAEDLALLREELRFQSLFRLSDLPTGVIHADLFRDNALFEGDALTGIIDFYYACNDVLLFDVAVTINDWCSNADGSLDEERVRAFLAAYREVRPFRPIERGAWPVMLRAAALRFWLSRLVDLHFPRPGEMTHTKDPDAFRAVLLDRIRDEQRIRGMWR